VKCFVGFGEVEEGDWVSVGEDLCSKSISIR
jgi:hypothetical protein